MYIGTSTDLHAPALALVGRLEAAWNAADGEPFGAEFADVSDFVTIRGEHLHGDAALIAAGHQGIFDTIYRGSTNSLHVDGVREIVPGCLLVHVTSTLDAPTGPLRGISRAQMSAVLVEQDGEWKVTAFHNTLIAS